MTEINAGAGDDNPDGAGDDGNGSGETRGGADGDQRRRGRRRGRRGGRRNRERGDGNGNGVPGLEAQPFAAGEDDAPILDERDSDDVQSGAFAKTDGDKPSRTDRNGHNERAQGRNADLRPDPNLESNSGRDDAPGSGRGRGRFRGQSDERPVGGVENLERAAMPREVQVTRVPEPDARPLSSSAPSPDPMTKPELKSEPNSDPEIPRHRQRAMAEPSEPKIERVVVRPDMGATEADPSAAEQPVRKGWWSRRFGGE